MAPNDKPADPPPATGPLGLEEEEETSGENLQKVSQISLRPSRTRFPTLTRSQIPSQKLRTKSVSYNHQKYCFEESEYSIFTVASHWTKEGCLQLDFSSSAVRFRPHNVFIPVRKSLDESRDIVKEQVKTFSSAHARNQSSPATMLTMSKFLEDNILERTAADLFTYLRSDTCPFTSVVKQALYDAIFQYSIMSVESRPTADGGLQTRKSYFSEKFDIICKLPTKERELALKESESLLQVLYEALMEDLKGKHSAHRAHDVPS